MLARKGGWQQQCAVEGKKFLARAKLRNHFPAYRDICRKISRLKLMYKTSTIVRDLLRAMAFLSPPPHQSHPVQTHSRIETFLF